MSPLSVNGRHRTGLPIFRQDHNVTASDATEGLKEYCAISADQSGRTAIPMFLRHQ